MKHPARPTITGWADVPGIAQPVALWSPNCADCGRPVRRMNQTGIFWHASGPVRADDPRRGERRPDWRRAISEGMKAANERRKAGRK